MGVRGTVLLWLILVGATMTTAVQAQDAALAQTSFRQWSGHLAQTTLADGSTLSEYTAVTEAMNQADAQLQVSFSPRFRCAPMIRLLVPVGIAESAEPGEPLPLRLDDATVTYPYTLDVIGTRRLLAYSASAALQERLLQQLDVASHAYLPRDLALASGSLQTDPRAAAVHFSLLGSQRSVAAVQEHCHGHVPVPFTLKTDKG